MPKRKLKIAISDYRTDGELLRLHYIFQLLNREYDLELDDEIPDLVLFSDRSMNSSKQWRLLRKKCLKVFFTEENVRPNLQLFDYAFSFDNTDERNFQLPGFAIFPSFRGLNPRAHLVLGEWEEKYFSHDKMREYRKFPKSRFCCFLYSNPQPPQRIDFCKKLMAYKKVDCGGKVLNNVPHVSLHLRHHFDFIKHYKFSIAFENEGARNYTTEKIGWALAAGIIPIYWGNPAITEYFNPKAFINCHDYDNFDKVIQRVIEVDNDEALYQEYKNAPPVLEGSKAAAITEEAILERLDKICREAVYASTTPRWSSPLKVFRYWIYSKTEDIRNRMRHKMQRVRYFLYRLKTRLRLSASG